MKKVEGVKEVTDLPKRYMDPLDEKKYDNVVKQVQKTNVWENATFDQKKAARNDLHDFIAGDSKSVDELGVKVDEYGVDATEYTLLQLAKEMAKDGDKVSKSNFVDILSDMDIDGQSVWDIYTLNMTTRADNMHVVMVLTE